MNHRSWLALAVAAAPSTAAVAQYETPTNPAPPAAQLQEMIGLYDSICLRAFPSDTAMAQLAAARGGVPLDAAGVRRLLHDDPGVGWRIAGRTGTFEVTIEAPPYHACAVRTLTVADFPDMRPYHDLAARFEGGGWQATGQATMELPVHVQTVGGGERHEIEGGTESLLVFHTAVAREYRDAGHAGMEVRFTHQVHRDEAGAGK